MSVKNKQELEVTNEEFEKIINNNSKKLIIVDFFAEWCMPCIMMTPILEDLSEKMKENIFIKINVDDNPDISSKYKVTKLPCFIIFKEGKEKDRITGVKEAEFIEDKINELMKN